MHDVEISTKIINRVLARRGRYHIFDQLDPSETALIVIDMQATFVEPDAPAEVPMSRHHRSDQFVGGRVAGPGRYHCLGHPRQFT